jgi:UDP-N-acetylmuramate--alanine ligase
MNTAMNLSSIHKIYFLGIGGIGMSALARYFVWSGKEVAGYDRTPTPLTRELESEGVSINYTDDESLIPHDVDFVVYTPAVPANSKQMQYLGASGLPMYKRAQVLGMIAEGRPLIAVAGTHGKTTVTSVLAHIFKTSGVEFMAFLGGISTNYNSNFIHTANPEWMIAEADEYDRSFLQLNPSIAVITSMDADHLDIYGSVDHLEESFRMFIGNLKSAGSLITHNNVAKLKDMIPGQQYYGLSGLPDFAVENIKITDGVYTCNLLHGKSSAPVTFGWAGRHNLENALAATAAALNAGIELNYIQSALSSFKGVKRRFEILVKNERIVYIDDYAHHPQEIKTCIHSAREMFPGKKILGIFQPHLYSRTRDLAVEFGESLDLLDKVAVMDIYPARELPIHGIDAFTVIDHIGKAEKFHLPEEGILEFVSIQDYDILITMGAGNIDRFVSPIKEILEK